MIRELLGQSISLTFVVLGTIHFYWAGGGTTGVRFAIPTLDGQPAFRPTRMVTALVGLALLCCAALVAGAAMLIDLPLPGHWSQSLATILAVGLVVRAVGDFRWYGFCKRVKGTDFARADTWIHSPLCLLLGLGILLMNEVSPS